MRVCVPLYDLVLGQYFFQKRRSSQCVQWPARKGMQIVYVTLWRRHMYKTKHAYNYLTSHNLYFCCKKYLYKYTYWLKKPLNLKYLKQWRWFNLGRNMTAVFALEDIQDQIKDFWNEWMNPLILTLIFAVRIYADSKSH